MRWRHSSRCRGSRTHVPMHALTPVVTGARAPRHPLRPRGDNRAGRRARVIWYSSGSNPDSPTSPTVHHQPPRSVTGAGSILATTCPLGQGSRGCCSRLRELVSPAATQEARRARCTSRAPSTISTTMPRATHRRDCHPSRAGRRISVIPANGNPGVARQGREALTHLLEKLWGVASGG